MTYEYTKRKIKSNNWYDLAIRRAFVGKEFTKQQFENKFISMYLFVADDSNIKTAKLKAAIVFSYFKKSGNIVEKVHVTG
jgi:hypothetical protein